MKLIKFLKIIFTNKTLADFVLKDKYKRLQSFGGKLLEIDSLIIWNFFRTIFLVYIF